MDEDSNGTISSQEFYDGVQVIGIPWLQKHTDQVFDAIDTDGSGDMNWAEFSHMMTQPKGEDQLTLRGAIARQRQNFFVFDIQGLRKITVGDLHSVLWCLGNELSENQVLDAFKISGADADGNGHVDFREFCEVLSGPRSTLQDILREQLGKLHAMFDLIDPTGKGFTSVLLDQCVQKVGRTLPATVLDNAVKHADTTKNGIVSFVEFVNLLMVKQHAKSNSDGIFAGLNESQMMGVRASVGSASSSLSTKVMMNCWGLEAQWHAEEDPGYERIWNLEPRQRHPTQIRKVSAWLRGSLKMRHLVFPHFTDSQLNKLSAHVQLHRFQDGDVILEEGGVARNLYVILSGEVIPTKKTYFVPSEEQLDFITAAKVERLEKAKQAFASAGAKGHEEAKAVSELGESVHANPHWMCWLYDMGRALHYKARGEIDFLPDDTHTELLDEESSEDEDGTSRWDDPDRVPTMWDKRECIITDSMHSSSSEEMGHAKPWFQRRVRWSQKTKRNKIIPEKVKETWRVRRVNCKANRDLLERPRWMSEQGHGKAKFKKEGLLEAAATYDSPASEEEFGEDPALGMRIDEPTAGKQGNSKEAKRIGRLLARVPSMSLLLPYDS